MTTIVGQGLAAHRAWASLRSSELFELYREKGPCGVPGADTAATETWRDLLATPEIDLLVLAVPPGDRVALGQAARGAGKAVLLEEGLPLSAAEIDQLAEDDGEGAALVGMVLPLRGLLAADSGILDREWTPAACGGLFLSGSAPRAASAQWGPADAAGPRADGGRLPEVLVRTVSPYLDLRLPAVRQASLRVPRRGGDRLGRRERRVRVRRAALPGGHGPIGCRVDQPDDHGRRPVRHPAGP
ncbi:hypothetical protein RB196_13080 [Streptomyces sp. PmtA]|uniref:hypothetical protein n=1 Tax=Streptomyces sp. PmtA TaxID=3074275 RepID=UPI0030144857